MNMELMQNIKGFLYLYVDGYKHTKNREGKSGRIFWRCSKRYCPGKVTTLHGRLVHKASHIHPPDRECSVTGSPGNHGDRFDEILCIKSDPDTDRIGKDMSECSFENLADGHIKILSDSPKGSKRPRLSKTCRESEEMDSGTSNINIDNVVMNRCSGASSLLQVTGSLGSVKQVVTTLNSGGRLLDMVKSVLPPLDYDQHKGQAGRIAVIGGSEEYTGAPYFAAISALKVGADLSHVFCSSDSAIVIKSYSPDLIVHPLLDQPKAVSQISEWLRRMHSLVIGPGLGRNPQVLHNVKEIIKVAQEMEIPIVIDADGLHLITEQPSVIQNYHKAILTPNVVEFARLFRKVMNDDPKEDEPVSDVSQLAAALGNVTVVRKGLNDIICDGNNVLVCCGEGSPRRCGGQGDLLSGSMAAFNYWTHLTTQSDQSPDESLLLYGPTICAAYAACSLTKEANRQAFEKHRRSTTTADMVDCIQSSFEQLYT